ncbi:LysR family transcriptional regulator [Lactobacillus sp.]|uniref:LysR family transcriptional regulator n=1 Tax=Lactobacillus sp. TaxID=1591 RepID=UPI0019851C8D|nr:LysR family transcriptional regulator [Lactobacillus sp.]MBD5430193.1 LysR family transcriptional regulator [Lactobacillus sp.]
MFNQIRYFISVVKNKNFTKAAEECHISQPAISQQIKELESELGVQLLERTGRSFTVTRAGKYFYNHSQDLLNNLNELISETKEIGNQKEEPFILHAGYLRNFGTSEFLRAVSEFSTEFSDVQLKITSGSHEKLFNMLEEDKLDIAFSDLRRAPSNKYVNKFLTSSNFEVLINKKQVDANQTKVESQALRDLPCILIVGPNEQGDEEKYYQDVLNISGDFVTASTYDEAIMMATLNQGYLIINDRVKDTITLNDDLVSLPLYNGDQQLSQEYYAFWKADNSGYYIESFFDILEKQFNN